jgi:hypothetical protein
MYNPIAFSPNDQIPQKQFASINSTNIYISSDKFVLIAHFLLVKNTYKNP